MSEYPRIPGILGRSQDVPEITCAGTLSTCIPGYLGYSDDPGMFLGTPCAITLLSEYPRILRILRQSQDVPRTTYSSFGVSQDSWDTRRSQDVPGTMHLCNYPTV